MVLAAPRRTPTARAAAFARAGDRVDVLDHGDDLVGYARARCTPSCAHADDRGLDALVAVLPPPAGLGHAIRDRLQKAAAGSRPTHPT